jgi:hypothetical protein
VKTVMRDAFERAQVTPASSRATVGCCVRSLTTKAGTRRKLVKRGNSDGPRPKWAGRWKPVPDSVGDK